MNTMNAHAGRLQLVSSFFSLCDSQSEDDLSKHRPFSGGNVNLQPPPPPPAPPDRSHGGNKVYKSGSLFLSSRGIGWTSWKKRWFILTNTSLIFFRSDPGSEANLTLGGIDLNNSGSVVIKADKKLLTVLFPDGRGRAFTLKAETSQDMYEWKEALEEALANAPNATTVMVQNGVFVDDQVVIADGSPKQSKERMPVKSSVIGQPILLALEDIDGTPTFLEKALRFIEEHGVKIEGILRQAADVDDIEHRVREYEQGKNEFCPEEDPHVIADCVKHVLRELPSSPVPASCCNALLEACRSDRGTRVTALRSAICETFPEPNRRLLQRILTMMQTVASHKSENRMSTSAVAACMAPLLLRSLLAGDCELENDFDVGGDGSVQLLQAAAAANHAQAIVITLLDEYENLFVAGGSMSPGIYSNSVESGSEFTDDETFEDVDDASEGSDSDAFEDFENMSGRRHSETEDDLSDHEGSERSSSGFRSPDVDNSHEDNHNFSSPQQTSSLQQNRVKGSEMVTNQGNMGLKVQAKDPSALLADKCEETSSTKKSASNNSTTCIRKSRNASNGTVRSTHRSTFWGRTPAKKNLSMESISVSSEDEAEIQRLEAAKADLQNRILEEAKGNAILQENLKKRKSALREHRLALEEDVATLQEQLQREKEFRTMLESGLKMSQKSSLPISDDMDGMMKAELEEITRAEAEIMNLKQKAGVLGVQVNQQREQNKLHKSSNQPQQTADHQVKMKDKKEDVSISLEKPTRTKDANSDEVDNGKDIKRESQPSPDEYLPQDQQYDQEHNSKYSVEPRVGKPVSNSKKSSSKGEAANSTTSALSKLTNRLNFLKERRTQITNDLVNSGQKYLDKGSSGGSESPQNSEKGGTTEGQKPHQSRDRKKRSGAAQSAPNLGRGKSESHVYVEKEPSIVPPRTYSR